MAFPPFLAILIRFAITTVLLSPWLFKIERRYLLPAFFLSFVMAVMYFGALFKGLQGVPAGEGSIVVQLEVPIAALLSSLLLKDKIKRRLWIAICICIFGVTLTVGMPHRMGDLLSIGFLVVASVLWAVNSIQMKCLSGLNPLTLNGVICAMSLPFLLALVLLFEPHSLHEIKTAPMSAWYGMAFMVCVSTIFCYSLWFWLLKKYSVSKITPFCLISPVAALLGSHIISEEALALHTLLGTAILLCGLALIVIKRDATAKIQDTEKLTDK